MSSFTWKWKVTVPASLFMAGVHRFPTKTKAIAFCDEVARVMGVNLTVEKA